MMTTSKKDEDDIKKNKKNEDDLKKRRQLQKNKTKKLNWLWHNSKLT
jgi:hypothetical protein